MDTRSSSSICPECGGALAPGAACAEYFHQMLFWENERAENGAVHHLAVLCYYLQHPSRYSPDGLVYAQELLVEFVEQGARPQQVRRQRRDQLASGKRSWKVTSRCGSVAAYPHPPHWTLTAADVVAAGIEQYRDSVHAWAAALLRAIRAANPEAA
jgi:hypothetical protein